MSKNESQEVATVDESTGEIIGQDEGQESIVPMVPFTSWDEAMAGDVAVVASTVLVNDPDDLEALAGSPFVITYVTFRSGYPMTWNGEEIQGAYVSARCILAPAEHGGKRLPGTGVEPGEEFVLNDGGTGMYRQIVAYLANQGIIELPEGARSGKRGTTIFDLPPSAWTEIHGGESYFDEEGFQRYETAVPPLLARRGVRTSTYTNPANKNETATTVYFQ